MTLWEYVRMACYVVSAPALLHVALWLVHRRLYATAAGVAALSALFAWYMLEITLASTGINTREYRVIGTPMIVIITISVLLTVARIRAGRLK